MADKSIEFIKHARHEWPIKPLRDYQPWKNLLVTCACIMHSKKDLAAKDSATAAQATDNSGFVEDFVKTFKDESVLTALGVGTRDSIRHLA